MRKRMIDPDIWQDEKVGSLSMIGRLTLIGLITTANDYGKLRGKAIYIKNQVFPFDEVSIKDVEKALKQIEELGVIRIYEVNGERFIILKNWSKYQTLRHPAKDNIPNPLAQKDNLTDNNGKCTDNEGILTAQVKSSKEKLSEVKRREVKLSKQDPSLTREEREKAEKLIELVKAKQSTRNSELKRFVT